MVLKTALYCIAEFSSFRMSNYGKMFVWILASLLSFHHENLLERRKKIRERDLLEASGQVRVVVSFRRARWLTAKRLSTFGSWSSRD